jgi:hypothetical protein
MPAVAKQCNVWHICRKRRDVQTSRNVCEQMPKQFKIADIFRKRRNDGRPTWLMSGKKNLASNFDVACENMFHSETCFGRPVH